ncbi:DEAD/DEAH box helicase [Bizionia paragorgiae]|uniref:Helicase conserved C-terminal domain-containing protein n=1 Tax=Bizionia paragorgiae TaxID=283786 RepID=A0A1H3WF18_BIZPA|nr:DEAD/DEAH box helicase [Bizionia paragorgiae]SDZ85736.1 Helicase conserved C-terminal domain-containing protein [Bizionia paragorgiae]
MSNDTLTNQSLNVTPGIRINLRGEDFIVTNRERDIIDVEGISELVYGQSFQFDLRLENYRVIQPEETELQADNSTHYRQTKLFLETIFRNSSHYSEHIEIAHKAAIRGANYQFESTIKALSLPQPKILIADAVGLGKTVQVGIFLAELIRRGKGKKVLVVTPKSILAQFQQEIWARFAIPLVRLDSQGIARIKTEIPSNKNPFDYYDKVIVSIDTLKNNAKFRHYLEKVKWDIVAIDECHTVANVASQRGGLAKFLSERTQAMVLTSATPHNGKRENFANLISMLDPTAIPYDGEFTKEDIQPLYVRRFKKDIEDEVGDAFRDRITSKIDCPLNPDEEEALRIIQEFKAVAQEESAGNSTFGALLFSIGLFKAYMSSPKACLETVIKRIDKAIDEDGVIEHLEELKSVLEKIVAQKSDSKYNQLLFKLDQMGWKGKKNDERIIIFAERRATLNELEKNLKEDFKLNDNAVVQFNGSLTDTQQQDILEDFSKEDSTIRLFLASDAGSQGVNLHYFCNQMFNYDIPWSIITLDQRNGRIDRFGQTKTPFIYYLIAESQSEDVQGDIRIVERLKEKEEEVHKSLGDAGSVMGFYDQQQESKLVEKAIANNDPSILDSNEENTVDDDWLSALTEDSSATKAQMKIDEGFASFYEDDFSYYASLIDELKSKDDRLIPLINIDNADKVLEIEQFEELSSKGVLYDMPKEAFPKPNQTFNLTTNVDFVENAIIQARKKQNEWPNFQLLYDLNPIAKWMQYKLLGQIDRGKALVARLREPLPKNTAWFVFQGITSNQQGKPIFSKTYVVGKSFDGSSVGNLEDFEEFLNQYRLKDTLPELETSEKQLQKIKELLPEAVKSAKQIYDLKIQGDLEDEMEDKLERYQKKLNDWLSASERQMEIKFGDEKNGGGSFYKKKRQSEVNYVKNQMDAFYNEYFQLENEPFLRVLAVFYNG